MIKVLFTMFDSNDLGPVSRLLPIAHELSKRRHKVAFSNRALVPSQLIQDAGFLNMPVQISRKPAIHPARKLPEVWNGNHFTAGRGFLDLQEKR